MVTQNQTQTREKKVNSNYDDDAVVPVKRYPLIIHRSGDYKKFETARELRVKPADMPLSALGFFQLGKDVLDSIQDGLGNNAPPGWQTITVENGKEVYAARDITIAIVGMRRCREPKNQHKAELTARHGWYDKLTDFEKGKYQSRLQILCYVKGFEQYGPFVVTMKTDAVDRMLGSNLKKIKGIYNEIDRGVLGETLFYQKVIAPLRINYPTLAPHELWLTLTHERLGTGNPVYVDVGNTETSKVCPLVWVGGTDLNDPNLKVDKQYAQALAELRHDTGDWRHEWDSENISEYNKQAQTGEADDENIGVTPAAREFEVVKSEPKSNTLDAISDEEVGVGEDEEGLLGFVNEVDALESLKNTISTERLEAWNNPKVKHGAASQPQSTFLTNMLRKTCSELQIGKDKYDEGICKLIETFNPDVERSYILPYVDTKTGQTKKYWGIHPEWGNIIAKVMLDHVVEEQVDGSSGDGKKVMLLRPEFVNVAGLILNT